MDRRNGFGGRRKKVSGSSGPVHKRGSGLNLGGPLGEEGGYEERHEHHSQPIGEGDAYETNGGAGSGGIRFGAGGGLGKLLPILLILVVLGGGGGGLMQLLGGGTGASGGHSLLDTLLTSGGGNYGNILDNMTPTAKDPNQGKLNTKVAGGARDKRTKLLGNGKDKVTIMVYMCGTDLESRYGMATSDMQEMAQATIGSNVNVLVYTGGCAQWKNNVVSNRTNQIYQIKDGGLALLEDNVGSKPMTDPDTLSSYIRWGTKHFPANRNMLIFWDHGGGSTGGYGHDELYPNSGSMGLDKINQALKEGGTEFDVIGFDACLMATLENASMLSQYADYLIASEETEPGIGWYYTNWLTKLSQDTSMPTIELGKHIVDDFIEACGQKTPRDQTTLSVIDLAEVESIVPDSLTTFAKSTGKLIQSDKYQKVSEARGKTKEFAKSVGIDQVDLIHLADNMDTKEGKQLSESLKSCVKYNRTSSNVGGAYGISIYFPYGKLSSMDKMVSTYKKIGMDSEYTKCIQSFASLETGGQAVAGGGAGSMGSLFELLMGQQSGSAQGGIESILGELMQGQGLENIQGLLGGTGKFIDDNTLENAGDYLEKNRILTEELIWQEKAGEYVLELEEEQWDLIQDVELNVFIDDGEGFIDLGLDNVYTFTDDGDLLGEYDGSWLAIDGQVVAYYMLSVEVEEDSYCITGRVPAMLNGELVDLILTFTDENPDGVVAGARIRYDENTTVTQAKGMIELQGGDQIDFLCDYYSYDRTFQNNYYLGEPVIVQGEPQITNVSMTGNEYIAAYRLTDSYRNHYWTEEIIE